MTGTRMAEGRTVTTSDATIEHGSGNVFADLGHPVAHLPKAELVGRIDAIVRQCGITQAEAGRRRGLSRPDVSRRLRGDFREYSLKRVFRLFTTLGRVSDAIIHRPRAAGGGKLHIAVSWAHPRSSVHVSVRR